MNILSLDKKHGRLKVKLESYDDFFVLSRFLREGDLITGQTSRKIKKNNKIYRESMVVTLNFKDASYQPFGQRLRISGTVTEGPEDFISSGDYHTINVNINKCIEIKRDSLTDEELAPLRKAEKYTNRPPILLVAIERGVATVGLLSSYQLRVIRSIRRDVPGKGQGEVSDILNEFFSKISSIIRSHIDETEAVIIAGPGFIKKNFKNSLSSEIPQEKIYMGKTSTGTRAGLHEIIRRNIPEKIRKDHRISKETRLIDEFCNHIGKNDGLGVYGYEKVKRAVKYGCVDTLLISTSKFYSQEMRENVKKLMRETRDMGGSVKIISTQHPSGKQFKRLGGIGALLRYKLR